MALTGKTKRNKNKFFKRVGIFIKTVLTASVAALFIIAAPNDMSAAATSFFQASNAPQYISLVYTWGSIIVGGLSLVVITYAGITYMRSLGNPEVISQSKNLIAGALVGLFLVLGGYTLLRIIDPRLVELKITVPQQVLKTAVTGGACTSDAGKSCKDDSDCPSCTYRINQCNTSKFSEKAKDTMVEDSVVMKCQDGKCVSSIGFCGVVDYGDNSSAVYTCKACDTTATHSLKIEALCPSNKKCSKIGGDYNNYNPDYRGGKAGNNRLCEIPSPCLVNCDEDDYQNPNVWLCE